ncbi:hypothetical protein [Flavobacterium sp. MDT1-60]|uniref:hypothetical protein n=1 Tax=Flavobacterium sp. MDT1-60 TaxID=1979344 RepID=UPI00351B5DB0
MLLKLKGVGEYTAAAIASFSYNEAVPVVMEMYLGCFPVILILNRILVCPATKKNLQNWLLN